MIPRYTCPDMLALWTPEAKFDSWLTVELAVMAVQEDLGLIPAGTHATVSSKACYNIPRIDEIELEVKHDVIAFLTNVGESVGDNSRFIHLGMTSSDLIDTALSLQLRPAGLLILQTLETLIATIHRRAIEHKATPMVGRSHGIHGEPISFGLKLLAWVDELQRHHARLTLALEENRVGMISGAMGTYANINTPQVEALVCERLGLRPCKTSTQVISRDLHAHWMTGLAGLASSMEKFAVEIRNLQRTDVLEVEEAFAAGQKGSSAMPHKRNPVSSENVTGLARLVRGYALPMLENVALWHERDISHSSVERVVLPDSALAMHYMLNRFNGVMDALGVHSQNMARNMQCYGGVIFSQRVLLALIEAGMSREIAYRLVQKNAHAAWNTLEGSFLNNVLADADITASLSPQSIHACFDPMPYLAHVDAIFARFDG
jgi:adenylosuccinate lyase